MSSVAFLNELLLRAAQSGASDVHIGAGTPIRLRIGGKLHPVPGPPPKPQDTLEIALHILTQAGRVPQVSSNEYARTLKDEDCAYGAPGVGRFRVNICVQRGSVALVMRVIPTQIPTIDGLGLPPVIREIAAEERGLILVTGITGSGKSTTLAAMLGQINATKPCKVVTIEDPVEFVYRDGLASIMQREVGSDTPTFAQAMRAAMRQDPDVILVGEMRDQETIDIALKAGETGHLVLSTVHTADAPKTLNRLMSFFDGAEQQMIRIRLSDTLKAVISQRLLPRADGKGRVPAVEIMRSTTTIKDCILNPDKTHTIPDYIKSGREQYGMQSFDQHLMELLDAGILTMDIARNAATSPSEFERNLVFV
jgi:twitching motility protein PilT